MSDERKSWSLNTRLNHPGEIKLTPGNRPLLQPIYHSAKFTPSPDEPYWDQFIYSRISNPTNRQLELSLAELQGKEDCLLLSSGIAAISTVFLSLLKSGDHFITFRELYKPTRVFAKEILPRYGIEHTIHSLDKLDTIEPLIIPGRTKLIHFESPTNPNLKIADITRLLKLAKKHELLVTMDGTFGGLHQHHHAEIDLMIQSLTKFGNGHGDVIAGSIAGGRELLKKIRETSVYLGAHLDPQAAYLISRGLKTYYLRYKRQSETALAIARFLEAHPKIKWVRYPGLKSHPENALATAQMQDMGAVIAFEIDPSVAESADKFCHKLSLIQLAASLGSSETIIAPTLTFFGTDLSPEERSQMGITGHSLRLSIGLEDSGDIQSDLAAALN